MNKSQQKKKPFYKKIGVWIVLLFCGALVIGTSEAMKIETEEKYSMFGDIPQERVDEALSIIKQCGVENVKGSTYDSLLDYDGLYGYRLSTELDDISDVCVYFDNEKLRQVKFLGQCLYMNQEVVAKAQDFYVSLDEASAYQYDCEEYIKSMLKTPSTAKFPNITQWGFSKENGVITVQSYVDSQNGFGAMIRSEFQFKIKDNKVTSLIFDGQEYIK